MITSENVFVGGVIEDRYHFDFHACTYKKGWCQIDTHQDASYFGIWTNPWTRTILTYAEGDQTIQRAGTDAEYSTILLTLLSYPGYRLRDGDTAKIDLGLRNRFVLQQRFAELGAARYCH